MKKCEKVGIIIDIKRYEDKTVFDFKSDKKYRVTCYKKLNFSLGDKVKVAGKLYNPSSNTVPNIFNYRNYLLSKRITMVIEANDILLQNKNRNIFFKIKNKIINKIDKYKSKAYLNAFITGDTFFIDQDAKQSFQSMGISHLFAISGMHIGVFLFVLNKLLKKMRYKNFVIFLFLLFFLFLTNFSESYMRCFVFLVLKYINKKINLKIKNIHLLILTALLLLFYNPYYIYNIGFLFSFVITFFIILSQNSFCKQKNYFIKLFINSIVCFLASIPILALFFFKINFLSPILNIIFIPLVSFLIFPLSLITFIFPFFDFLLVSFTNVLEILSMFLSKFTLLTFTISKPNLIIVLLYYLTLYITFKINLKFMFSFILILIFNLNSRYFIFNPIITFLDVGQGDSSVIILSKGKTIIIDTGGLFFSNYSIVKNKTIPYLNSLGINKVEYLILSHGDYDHIGETINLLNNLKINKVIFNYDELNSLEKKVIKVSKLKKIKYFKGYKKLNIDNNKLYFLNSKIYNNENDNSNVLYFDYYNLKFLFMGDAGIKREQDIIEKYNLTNILFLKVGHHGSSSSSSENFIDNIKPKNCLISVGKKNKYGHPKQSVLNILKNSKIYRTDKDGSIEIKLNKSGYVIRTCPP